MVAVCAAVSRVGVFLCSCVLCVCFFCLFYCFFSAWSMCVQIHVALAKYEKEKDSRKIRGKSKEEVRAGSVIN